MNINKNKPRKHKEIDSKLCGAKTRTGQTCKKWAVAGKKRCRLHGGESPGGKKGNKSNLKHGFYSKALSESEQKLYSIAVVGSVDDEIKLAKTKLYRYVKLSGNLKLQSVIDGAIEIIGKQSEELDGEGVSAPTWDKREIKVCAPDYHELILKCLDSIRKLEATRHQMNSKPIAGSEAEDMAQHIFISPDEPTPEDPIL